jgi:hypothetical protein
MASKRVVKKREPRPLAKKLTDRYLNSLPLWKLMDIGMRDLAKQEKAKDSRVVMSRWLGVINPMQINEPQICVACLAGSVMRFSCGLTEENDDYTPEWAMALNDLRIGLVTGALHELDRDINVSVFNRDIGAYAPKSHGRGWWKQIRKLRDELKAAGI